jgi:hypothetical protein
VGAIWDIFIEVVAICFLVLILVVAFATCLTVSMGDSDPLFTSFGTSGSWSCERRCRMGHACLGMLLLESKHRSCYRMYNTTFHLTAETLLRLLFGDSLPYSSFYNTSSPLEESSRFKLMM